MIDVWKIVRELEEVLKKTGWEVNVQEDSMFMKSGYKQGHINIGKYRQAEDQIEIVYNGPVPEIDTRKTRVRLMWNLTNQALEEMRPGSQRVRLHTGVDIPEVAAEHCRKFFLGHWKELVKEAKFRQKMLEGYKASLSKISPLDLGNLRGIRAGRKFKF
jgi:hypothetical protein